MTKEVDDLEEKCDDYEKRLRHLERTNWGLLIAAVAPALVVMGLVFSPIWSAINDKVDKEAFVTHQSYVIREFGETNAEMLRLRKDWQAYTEAKKNPKIIGNE
mgnify:CR=1 FL=1|tara:strand:+ start:87 stop:395 length:309 start_codon:yes stop_codon:yes gene_type:complete